MSFKDAAKRRLLIDEFLAKRGVKKENYAWKVITPSGGLHVFVVTRKKCTSRMKITTEVGTVDFLSENRLAIMANSYNHHYSKSYEVDYCSTKAVEVLKAFDPMLLAKKKHELEKAGLYIAEGERDESIFKLALKMGRAGSSIKSVTNDLNDYNQKFLVPPLPNSTILKCVSSAFNYVDNELGTRNKKFYEKLNEESKSDMEAIREYLEPYVYVFDTDRYINKKNVYEVVVRPVMDKKLLDRSFNVSKKAGMKSATDIALAFNLVETVDGEIYDAEKERITGEYINLYRPPPWTVKKDYKLPDVLAKHFEVLIPVERERKHFISWLAYNIQFPSRKIAHAVLLYSAQTGVGKSFFQRLMSEMVGKKQVFVIEQGQLLDLFTDWQEKTSLLFFHELYGRRGQDVAISLQSKITEDETTIRRPYKAAYNIPNTYNIMACSNHLNALKLGSSERRWFVVSCDGLKGESLQDEKYASDYYKNLYGLLRDEDALENIYSYFMKFNFERL